MVKGSDLHEKLTEFAETVRDRIPIVKVEDQAREYLIRPFFESVLHWVFSDPIQCEPQFSPELAPSSDKVDYALKDRRGAAAILVEAKVPNPRKRLSREYGQLKDYMTDQPTASFGVLTNGCQYLWYTRQGKSNNSILEQFLDYDVLNPTLKDANFLLPFVQSNFEPDHSRRLVSEIDLEYRILNWLENTSKQPSDQFTKWLVKQMREDRRHLNLPYDQVNKKSIPIYKKTIVRVFEKFVAKQLLESNDLKHSKLETRDKDQEDLLQPQDKNLSCKLRTGKVLNRFKTIERAYWFERPGYIACSDGQSAFLTLLSHFAISYPHGPDEFVQNLCASSHMFCAIKKSKRYFLAKLADQKIWVCHARHDKKRKVIAEAATWFNPPLIEGSDYGLWIPEGKPKKHSIAITQP